MESVLRCGAYKVENQKNNVVLVIRKRSGTTYFAFSECDFLNGWCEGRADGATASIRANADAELAIATHSITPTFLSRCGKSGPNRIKWASKRSVAWKRRKT